MSSDPVPSSAIYDATTGGRSVIVITGGSTGDVLTLQPDGSYSAVTPSGGVTGTGAVDNAALRADGAGGATLQNSNLVINDNLTASPNNTINHLCVEATGDTTNVSVSVKPKGTGAFMLSAPDGTTTGGNVRGDYAVDLQRTRAAATNVASAEWSCIIGGNNNTASGSAATASGTGSVASGNRSFAGGEGITASGRASFAFGAGGSAAGYYAVAWGENVSANRHAMHAHSGSCFAANGDAQKTTDVLRRKTTNSTPTTLLLGDASSRLTVASGKILFANILISGIKSDGSAAACYKRKVAIKNVGGTTSLVGSVETIGTDIEDNASTDVTITADNTNDALDISVTGIAAETWRWVAVVEGLEIGYGA